MPDNTNNNIETNQLIQKFVKDRNESIGDEKSLSHHRNGIFQSVKNTEVFAVNESANLLCITLPYKFLGSVELSGEQRHLIFSGDETNSEIGIGDTLNCKYTKLVNSKCLSFSKYNNPITGFLRINSNQEEEVIFVDGDNSDRIINLSNIPYTYTIDDSVACLTKEYTNNLDCNELLLNPNIDIPCIETTKSSNGNLPDGVYFVSVSYLINDIRFTDYYSSSLAIQINNKAGSNSIDINLSNLDRNFDKYQILLSGNVKGVTTHKIIGRFSTSQSHINISDWVNDEYEDGIPSTELTVSKKLYDKTGILSANSEYLFRADVKRKSFINYQPQAFNIKSLYYVKQVPLKYYKNNGEDIGYFRNENYNFVLRWYYTDGEHTDHFQIAGRKAKQSDLAIATGKDIFEIDKNNKQCDTPDKILQWQAYNTAQSLINVKNDFKCEERIIGYGEPGYNESTINYPDDIDIYGDNACTPIRNHRTPDEAKCPRYSIIDGEIYVNIIGFKFLNIEHPKDENGEYIKNISHYEILRSERDQGNSTVISRGIVTNMGGYTNSQNKKILYSNFPFNSLQPNSFLSSKQTYTKHGREYDFNPLSEFYNDKYTYYTPFGNYFGRRQLNGHLEFETEESGTVNGYFEETYKHPKHKLLTNFTLFFALAMGAIEGYILLLGNRTKTKNQKNTDVLGTTQGTTIGGTSSSTGSVFPTQTTSIQETVYSFPDWSFKDLKPAQVPVRILLNTIKTLVSLGAFIFTSAKFGLEILEGIKSLSQYQQYARQYNGEVLYNIQHIIKKGNKRRKFLRQPFYLDNAVQSIGNYQINNGGRNSSIFIELSDNVNSPSIIDTSRKTISEYGIDTHSNKIVNATSSAFYVTHKQNNPNQYGSIEGVKPVKTHTCLLNSSLSLDNNKESFYESPIIFGGDCIIAEQTHINKFPIFRQNLANTEYRDGIEYDYRLYNNIGYSRYWFDSTDYDMGNLMRIFGKSKPTEQKLPNQKYNLDGKDSKDNKWVQEDQCIYTSVNGVIRYIGEVNYNISFRDNLEEGDGTNLYQPHYSDDQTDLSYIFRSDLQVKKENFQLDPSYKNLDQKYVASEQIIKLPKSAIEEKNTVLYSLPSTSQQSFNNWRYFLPLNRFSFDERDYGELTGVHSIDQDRIMFLFSKASPFILPGRDELQTTNGRNITIGDGGLFAQIPREYNHTDVAYGSNHDRYAFKSTQFGRFYVSELQGKLFNFSDKLHEYSDEEGWDKWCAEFLPIRLKREFPNYKQIHNPISGVGYQIGFDNLLKTIYVAKKDFSALENVTYNEEKNKWYYNGGLEIELGDPLYFEDCSITISFHCQFGFQSFHDWFPDAFIQEERHFLSVKNNTLWKHNDRNDLFCNYYGKDYPYEIGFQVSTGQNEMILAAIEYVQEAYIYKTNTLDRFHVYDQTFDYSIISNSEQLSGLLHLNDATNIRYEHELYPQFIGTHHIEIPFKKVENKFRFNMFYDYIKDRGRFSSNKFQPFITKKNGLNFIINQPALDFSIQRPPRFRHYFHNVWMAREKSDNIQFITKFNNTKLILSAR